MCAGLPVQNRNGERDHVVPSFGGQDEMELICLQLYPACGVGSGQASPY